MIIRIWHGRIPASLGDEYFEYIKKTGVEGYRSTEGNSAKSIKDMKGIKI